MRPSWEQDLIRQEVFHWLGTLRAAGQVAYSRQQLLDFEFRGTRIPLLDQSRGIRNPRDFSATLSLMTSADRRQNPYEDIQVADGLIRYDYRVGDGGDNVKLRKAAELRTPIVYFEQRSRSGDYYAHYPMIVHDDPAQRRVLLAFEDDLRLAIGLPDLPEVEQRYLRRLALMRLHQGRFREMVMEAYRSSCAVCALKQPRLLDAAHITPDGDPQSIVHVTNGLALCKMHHSAYDANFLGISPDYVVHIKAELLAEQDGPMLEYGLKQMHGEGLHLPVEQRQWPDRERLERRYSAFAS